MIIGITGGTGCGKTTLLNILAEYGYAVLDCDAIYHRLLETDKTLLTAIETRFPGTTENGTLQRKRLGQIVFSDPASLADLNRITHSAVKQEILHFLLDNNKPTAIDAIGLFEGGLAELCDLTVAVTAPDAMRMDRLMRRDDISAEYARKRMAAQRSQTEFEALCDYTLVNDGSEAVFREKCLTFLRDRGIINL